MPLIVSRCLLFNVGTMCKRPMCNNGCEDFLRAPEMRQIGGGVGGGGLCLWGTGLANTNVALKRSV